MEKFNEIKTEILRRAKEADACTEQYSRAYKSLTLQELLQVVKDNFRWACRNNVLTVDLIEKHKEEFAANDIYANQTIQSGYLLCNDKASVVAYGNTSVVAYGKASVVAYGNASVVAYGNASVEAWGNASVVAYDNASVEAYGKASVVAYGKASVVAWGNAYCTSYSMIECKLSDHAIYRVRSTNTVYFADDNMKFVKVNQKNK